MLDIHVITKPTAVQTAQIGLLYGEADWWHPTPEDADTIARLVAGSHCFVTAVRDGRIVGMGRAISDGISDAYIQDVVVLPTHRRRGVGRRIVTTLVDRLIDDGVAWIGLVAEGASHRFYQSLGFQPLNRMTPMRYTAYESDTA